MRSKLIVAAAAALAVAVIASSAPAAPALRCDPDCNTRVTTALGPANEVTIAVNPTDPNNLIAAAKDYNLGPSSRCGVRRVWGGIYHSTDGGRTWSEQNIPAPSHFGCVSDPVLAFGPDGTAYYIGLAIGGPDGVLFVCRSDDGGATWTYVAPFVAGADKQWAAVDPDTGRLWVTWVQGLLGIRAGYSDDGGQTWTRITPATGGVDTLRGQGPQIAIGTPGPGGTRPVYIAFRDLAGPIHFLSSTDAGATWLSRPVVTPTGSVGDFFVHPRGYRAPMIPTMAVDTSGGPNDGRITIAYTDATPPAGEAHVVHSSDGGLTWTPPIPVSATAAATDELMPALTIDGNGVQHVFAYRATALPRSLDLWYFRSADGLVWDAPMRVTTASSDPSHSFHQTGAEFIGDYIGAAAASDGTVYAAWADTRNGRADVYTAAIE